MIGTCICVIYWQLSCFSKCKLKLDGVHGGCDDGVVGASNDGVNGGGLHAGDWWEDDVEGFGGDGDGGDRVTLQRDPYTLFLSFVYKQVNHPVDLFFRIYF